MLRDAHGQMVVTALIALLERRKTLPCPKDCPQEVRLHVEKTMQFIILQAISLDI